MAVFYLALDVSKAVVWIAKFLVDTVFQLYLNNMLRLYATVNKMLAEEFEQQIRLAAATYTSYYFYPTVPLVSN